jgi:hypothetical protein
MNAPAIYCSVPRADPLATRVAWSFVRHRESPAVADDGLRLSRSDSRRPKDEYQLLCRALGVEPFRIGPGLQTRINPLSFGPLAGGWDQLNAEEAQSRAAIVFGRWLTLVHGLVGSQRIGEHRVPFGPTDEVVVKAALQQLTGYRQGYSRMREVTIPQLWQLLDDPTDDLVTQCRYESRRHFLNETRLLRDALGQLVSGALAGLFDDHSTIDV